ncbi:cytochrome b5, seed isoform-like [Chrysoperla carnea]|uniref:cytochrome b5, seed isoform-like n=1 Tax=Chrysoperla carnea TaxID=189513 RepID=UPI001D06CB58|nr:cytochrome b5, seed isoform-like [Chrysoperla carnea]
MTAIRLSTNSVKNRSLVPSIQEHIITMEEVLWHDNAEDCWIILYDRVYNITEFLLEHPGGADVLLEHAGRDATLAFRGAGHSINAINILKRYHIGILPLHERIFRKPGGLKLKEMPE